MKYILFIYSLFLFFNLSAQDQINSDNVACSQVINGSVTNFLTGEIIQDAEVQLFKQGELISSIETGSDGVFSFTLDCSTRYNINGRAENFTINSKIVYTTSKGDVKELELKLYPTREFVQKDANKYIDTNGIDFETDVNYISESSVIELDKVVNILRKYPKMRLSIDVHTDSQGETDYSLNITKERADIIMNYLIEKGIEADRLEANGFGDTKLINQCAKGVKCTEQEHKQNKRIEFVVLE